MQIRRSKIIGFCTGVRHAVKMAEENPGAYIAGGQLVHNPLEIKRLSEKFNVVPAEDISRIPSSATAVIRAHGIAEAEEDGLSARGVKIAAGRLS